MKRGVSVLSGSLLVAASACSAAPAERADARAPRAPKAGDSAESAEGGYRFPPNTRSPQPWKPAGGELGQACPVSDAGLARVAVRAAARALDARAPFEDQELTFALRAEGAPYVWPRVWTLAGPHAAAGARVPLDAWLAERASVGERRCAVAVASGPSDRAAVAALVVDVLADLAALPTRARVGAWLDVQARLLVPASDAKVLVLGPRGAPHAVTASFEQGLVRARARVDSAGAWLIQVLASVEGGPRPVAEALVFAGTEPSRHYAETPAPGEDAADGGDPNASLVSMANSARRTERLASLARDVRLDALAEAHARAMLRSHTLAHDVGDGSPVERAEAAGLEFARAGENVAHAATALSVHRTLWASPSHRANLLERSFDAIGVGSALDADGTLWVCELFAGGH